MFATNWFNIKKNFFDSTTSDQNPDKSSWLLQWTERSITVIELLELLNFYLQLIVSSTVNSVFSYLKCILIF